MLNALVGAQRLRRRPTSTTWSSGTARATATTASASAGSRSSPRGGPSRRRASRSTASAARASRRSRSVRWGSGPASRSWSSAAASSRCRAGTCATVRPDFTARNEHLREQFPLVPQGISADLIATLEGFTRDEVDTYAVQSQERAAKAQVEGRFDGSLVAVHHADGSLALDHDEHLRPGTTLEALAGLSPVVRDHGHDHVRGLRPLVRRDVPAGLPAGRARRARAPRRQLVGRRRRRGGGRARVERLRDGARADAARPDRDARGRRHRAGHHAHRARTGDREGARAGAA